jgi:hypothetical protein
MKQINLNGIPFYKVSLDNSSIKNTIVSDANNNYDSTFDHPVSSMSKEDFLNLYNDTFKDFQLELEATQFKVEKIQGWAYTYKTGSGFEDHSKNPSAIGHNFTLIHFLKLNSEHPTPHFIIQNEKVFVPNLKENDLIIFPSRIIHGFDTNTSADPLITFNVNISLVE